MSTRTVRHSALAALLCAAAGLAAAAPAPTRAPARAAVTAARPAAAPAAEEPGFTIRPRIGIAGMMDSNIFLTPEEADSAWIAEPSVALGLGLVGRKAAIQAGYEIVPRIYSVFQKSNNAVHQTAALAGRYEFMPEGLVGLDDQFRVTSDPATSELTSRLLRNQNDAGFLLDVPVGSRLYFGVRATDTVHHYREADFAQLLDRNELTLGGRLGMRPSPKTKVYAFYKLATVDYKSASSVEDSKGNLIGAGVEGQLTSRITGIVEVNSVSRDYSKTVTGEQKEYTTAGYTVALKWEGPDQWAVVLSGGRNFTESIFNRYYMSTGGMVAVSKDLSKRFSAEALVGYTADSYPNARDVFLLDGTLKNARRADANVSVGVNVWYHLFENQTFKLGWLMRQRSSNFDVYKYTDSQITLSADYIL